MNKIQQNKVTLSFHSRELEQSYLHDFAKNAVWQVRLAILLAGFIFTFYGVFDLFVFYEYANTTWVVRVLFVLICIAIFLLTYTEHYPKFMRFIPVVLYLTAGTGLLYKMWVIGSDSAGYSFAGLVLIFMWPGIRFIHAVMTGFVLIVCYEYLAIVILKLDYDVIFLTSFYLIGGYLISSFSNFIFESYLRRRFMQQHILGNKLRQYEHLSRQLSKYISPQVYNSIFVGYRDVKIGSYRKYLTIFFSDIVNFTSASENKQPDELAYWLNDYLNEMSQIALNYRGTLDKFIGDGMMVFFGDPHSAGRQSDALYCIIMAIAMRNKAREMQIDIRIGINSGECTVGNFGSVNRMEYTVVGKPVNVAAYIEKASRPDEIIISEETYNLVKHIIQCEALDEIDIKGVDDPVNVYRVIED